MTEILTKVDHSAIRVNQAFIIVLTVVAFIANLNWLAGIVALVMLAGSLAYKKAGFGLLLYFPLLKRLGWVNPDVLADNPEPHLFAQGFGGTVMALSTLALYTGLPALGWGLAWLVVALAALNLFGGFCVGCAMYYWLHRLNVPGFVKSPPEDTFPGMRPGQVNNES